MKCMVKVEFSCSQLGMLSNHTLWKTYFSLWCTFAVVIFFILQVFLRSWLYESGNASITQVTSNTNINYCFWKYKIWGFSYSWAAAAPNYICFMSRLFYKHRPFFFGLYYYFKAWFTDYMERLACLISQIPIINMPKRMSRQNEFKIII